MSVLSNFKHEFITLSGEEPEQDAEERRGPGPDGAAGEAARVQRQVPLPGDVQAAAAHPRPLRDRLQLPRTGAAIQEGRLRYRHGVQDRHRW